MSSNCCGVERDDEADTSIPGSVGGTTRSVSWSLAKATIFCGESTAGGGSRVSSSDCEDSPSEGISLSRSIGPTDTPSSFSDFCICSADGGVTAVVSSSSLSSSFTWSSSVSLWVSLSKVSGVSGLELLDSDEEEAAKDEAASGVLLRATELRRKGL